MNIKITSKNGITLKTKGKYCNDDIEIGLSNEDKETLIGENIAEGKTILGITGTHKGESKWQDKIKYLQNIIFNI